MSQTINTRELKLSSLKQKFMQKINDIKSENITSEQKIKKIDKIKKRYQNVRSLIMMQPEINLLNPYIFNMMQNNASQTGNSYYHAMSVTSSYTGDDKITHVKHKKFVDNNGKRKKKTIQYHIDRDGNKIMN